MGPVPSTSKLLKRSSELSKIMEKLDFILGDVGIVESFGSGSLEKYLQIIRRASIVRQREAIEATIRLIAMDRAAFAVCFLRPAYEEMLWMMYLKQNHEVAPATIMALSEKILGDSLDAQASYMGAKNMNAVGLNMRRVKRAVANARAASATLRAIGVRLGWRQGADLPSVAFIARKVGREKEYNYIYEATSRYVHFSPHELIRRAWGTPERITITSLHFQNYWSEFSMHWSLRIFVETVIACEDVLTSKGDAAKKVYEELFAALEEHVIQVPIITSEELAWPY